MSDSEIEKLSRYCSGVYYRNYNLWLFDGMTYEDFKQTFLLLALENPSYSPSLLMRLFRYKRMCAKEAVSYKVENMQKFCDLIENGFETEEDIFETFGETTEQDFLESSKSCIFQLAKILYKDEEFRERFLDYMHGQQIGSGRQRDCRKKCFKNRFFILEFLFENGKISLSEKNRFTELAESMTRYAPVPKVLSQTSSAIACRKFNLKRPNRPRKRKVV